MAWRILRHDRPDLLVSAGTGVAIGFFLAAKVRGVPALWLETLNVVTEPGLASRMCSRLAARVLVQRPEQLRLQHAATELGLTWMATVAAGANQTRPGRDRQSERPRRLSDLSGGSRGGGDVLAVAAKPTIGN
jgi:UDP-N-acetylglucosamine:LPS N-acetylglucosamine transferase